MHFYFIKLRWLVAMALAALFMAVAVCVNISVPTFSQNGRQIPIYSVERSDSKVALTFDCAWNNDDITEILDILDRYDCRATFFLLGDWAVMYPQSVREIYDRGHEIGTHSMSHRDYTKMSSKEILNDINMCEDIIFNITTNRPMLVRAPSGAYNDTVINTCEENGRIYVQWSVDGIDYEDDATTESIINRVTEKTAAGDIILLHNGTAHTAEALPSILENLTANYEVGRISDLIYLHNFTIDANGRQHENISGD